MEISPVMRDSQPAPVAAPVTDPATAAGNREIIQAVKAVNKSELLGQENELLFQMDQRTQRLLIRVVNRQTGDVVSQVPPEYVLRLAEDLRQNR